MIAEPGTAGPSSSTARLVQLILLGLAAWAVVYARFALAPVQEALRVDLALSDNLVALLQGPAIAIPMALVSIPMGLYVDRHARAPVLIAAIAACLALTVATAMLSSLAGLFIARGVIGASYAVVIVAAYSAVGDLYQPAERGRATTLVSVGENLGAPAAFALGGMLLVVESATGAGTDLSAWRISLLWMAVPLLVILAFMILLREPARSGVAAAPRNVPFRQSWRALWDYRGIVVPLLAARIMVWIADGAAAIWGGPTLMRDFHLGPDAAGAIMGSALLAGSLLGPMLGGLIADVFHRRGGPRATLGVLAVLACLSVPAGLFALYPNSLLAGLGIAVFIALGYMIGVTAVALSIIVLPGALRGLYLGITVTIGASFSIGVAPLAVSVTAGLLGGETMIGKALAIVCTVTSLAGALVFAIGRRTIPVSAAADGQDASAIR